ncbi:MAG: AmmeMemoRadiSam system protein B [Chloroflexi bacterium]|nr:AmmeMemoRadiSam system protein B [Chloroflexota bacterium]
MAPTSDVRPSPIAGLWYSGDPIELRQQVRRFIDQADVPELDGEVIGVVAPHAGLRYSGRTAGHAFRAVRGQSRDLVAIVSPFHDFYPAMLLTSAHAAYTSPLGEVWIDRPAVDTVRQALKDEADMVLKPIAQDGEHSLEIELPFLQVALQGDFRLLPVMVHSQSGEVARALGQALVRALQGRKALLVASTDLSHFYPEDVAEKYDYEMLQRIASFSPQEVIHAEESGAAFACGAAAVAAVLWAARDLGANAVEILHHSTSADETGDHQSVVGYGAAVILKRT